MFESIIGHNEQKTLLMNEIENNNISHAYLFTGKKGTGKATLAKEFAKEILGVQSLESSPDYRYISKKEDKKDIVIDQIRKELIDDIYTVPSSGDRKVYIIDDAEYLNTAAQNALLKTLEEPPKYIVVILITSNISAILTTVLSRVNKIFFDGVSTSKLVEYIENSYNKTLNSNILEFVEGSIGFAIQIIEQNLEEKFNSINKLYENMKQTNVIESFKLAETVNFSEHHMLEYLEYLLYTNCNFYCTNFVEKAFIRLKYNGNYDIVIDNMILKIIDNI